MADPDTGLPADNIGGDLDPATRSAYTSPTNIGAYLWATVVARDTGLIGAARGPRTGCSRPSTPWPGWSSTSRPACSTTGTTRRPAPSSPPGRRTATRSTRSPPASTTAGWPSGCSSPPARTRRSPTRPTRSARRWTSATTTTRPRASGRTRPTPPPRSAARSAAASGSSRRATAPATPRATTATAGRGRRLLHLPPLRGLQHRAPDRVLPGHRVRTDPPEATTSARCGPSRRGVTGRGSRPSRPASGASTSASTSSRARFPYRDLKLVPTWGGSMFEALMVPLFVPEETWGKRSWGVNHPLYVRAQIEHGLDEAGYGYWGFSPSNDPAGGYREYGVDALGMDGRRLHLRPGADRLGPALRGLPRPAGRARADDVRRRRGDPARVVPRAALRTRGRRSRT